MNEKCHFIGIGGIGMSGLARILLSRNCEVTGSDLSSNYITEGLKKAGAQVYIGHSAANIQANATVIFSSDIKHDNPEFLEAKNRQCLLLHRSDLLAKLMQGYKTIAIAGTHGKTTTSALMTWVLKTAQMDPSFAIGGILPALQTNAESGLGEYFVAEADESDGTFLKYHPFGAIVTNIDLDHMNHFGDETALEHAFKQFMEKVTNKNLLLWCGDDERLKKLKSPGLRYGFHEDNDIRIANPWQIEWKNIFDLHFEGKTYSGIELNLIGRHNVLNAAAVFAMALKLGIPEEAIRLAFLTFGGVMRRCEKKGEYQSVLFIDDYAHHPTEIKTTLNGIRKAVEERRIIGVFQPHRYSRTQDCLGTFGGIFNEVDELYVTDIFSAGEQPIEGVTAQKVYEEIRQTSKIPIHLVPRESLAATLCKDLRPRDVVVGLGAGDITKLASEAGELLKQQPPKKWKVGLIFGGLSTEHEISLKSARYVNTCMKSEFYDITHFGISKQGHWLTGQNLLDQDALTSTSESKAHFPDIMRNLMECDVLFPVLHGPYGEDGTVQGFFEMIDKAYVGCDYRSAAICMDKVLTKSLMVLNGVPTSIFTSFLHHEWKDNPHSILNHIKQTLQFPVFVKPAHLGSSIGVKKVEQDTDLPSAIEHAFQYDNKIIVENGINGREIEFAVLGNEHITVFPPGEICTGGKVYDYNQKYGANSMQTMIQADLPQKTIEEGMNLARYAYRAAGCEGMARVDFFLDNEGRYFLNEINPIPGFTQISLYPKMCEAHGLNGPNLVDRLILLALQRKRHKLHYETTI